MSKVLFTARLPLSIHPWRFSSTLIASQHQLRRHISSYLQRLIDRVRPSRHNCHLSKVQGAGKDDKKLKLMTNPLLRNHRIVFGLNQEDPSVDSDDNEKEQWHGDDPDSFNSINPSTVRRLNFASVSPQHVRQAYQKIEARREDELRVLVAMVESDNGSSLRIKRQCLQRWNQIEAPLTSLRLVSQWLSLMDHHGFQLDDVLDDGRADEGGAESTESNSNPNFVDRILDHVLQRAEFHAPTFENVSRSVSEDCDDGIRRACHSLVQKQRDMTGYGIIPEDRRREYLDLLEQVRQMELQLEDAIVSWSANEKDPLSSPKGGFWQSSSPAFSSSNDGRAQRTRRLVSAMYGYLKLTRRQAQFLGHESLVSQAFDTKGRTAAAVVSLSQVQSMHEAVAAHLSPILHQLAGRDRLLSSAVLSSYLAPSGPLVSSARGGRISTSSPLSSPGYGICLEKHVTLEGAIKFATRIVSDLFGLMMVEDDSSDLHARTWHGSVRLFHVYQPSSDSRRQRFLGSFYLDPVARPSKLPRNVTSILYPHATSCPFFEVSDTSPGLSSSPVILGVSLSMEPSVWEEEPVRMRWEDVVAFLHELGHVVDVLLLHSFDRLPLGAIAGHSSLPVDRSEILPKFMELCMTNASSIYALLELSESTDPFSHAEIEAALVQQSSDKCLQVAQQLFDGKLELELFSSKLDLHNDSILALQRDLARKYIPHDVPSASDLAPLAETFHEVVARGRQVSGYRYLLGDVVSANLFRDLQEEQSKGMEPPIAVGTKENLVRTLKRMTAGSLPDSLLDPAALWNLYRIDIREG